MLVLPFRSASGKSSRQLLPPPRGWALCLQHRKIDIKSNFGLLERAVAQFDARFTLQICIREEFPTTSSPPPGLGVMLTAPQNRYQIKLWAPRACRRTV